MPAVDDIVAFIGAILAGCIPAAVWMLKKAWIFFLIAGVIWFLASHNRD